MLGSLRNLFQGRKSLPEDLTYEDARAILEDQNHASKLELAERAEVPPEILYFLASDESEAVRRQVAKNPATPLRANKLLVEDTADSVRAELARKIARLLPDSDDRDRAATRERAIELLEQLARDQLPKVREILAEELKACPSAPYSLIRALAADPVLAVSAPILEYSPLLSDDDLREIIALCEVKGALAAIARRTHVSEAVADGIAAALDIPAVAALLANPNAHIREDTLNFIIDNAAAIPDWHEPLVHRPNLSIRLMRRIAGFVASSLIEVMIREHDLGAGDGEALLGKIRDRIQTDVITADDSALVQATVKDLHARGAVNEQFILEAIETHNRDAVLQALSLLGDLSLMDVQKIIDSKNARRIVALCWYAKLGMRTAFRIQSDVAQVPWRQLVNARDGVDYPLTPAQMQDLLEPFLA